MDSGVSVGCLRGASSRGALLEGHHGGSAGGSPGEKHNLESMFVEIGTFSTGEKDGFPDKLIPKWLFHWATPCRPPMVTLQQSSSRASAPEAANSCLVSTDNFCEITRKEANNIYFTLCSVCNVLHYVFCHWSAGRCLSLVWLFVGVYKILIGIC